MVFPSCILLLDRRLIFEAIIEATLLLAVRPLFQDCPEQN